MDARRFFLVIAMVCGGCATGPDGATPQGPGSTALFGSWSWVSSTGGFAGVTLVPPPEKRFVYREDGMFLSYRDDSLVAVSTYAVSRETTIFGGGPAEVIHYGNPVGFPDQAFRIRNDTLFLSDLCIDCFGHTFVRICAAPQLEGIVWRVRELNGYRLAEEDTITVSFGRNRLTGASSGRCGNVCGGNYRAGPGNGIAVSSLSSTKAACPLSAYWDVLHMLSSVRSYSVAGGKLVLRTGDLRDAMIVFEPSPRRPAAPRGGDPVFRIQSRPLSSF